MLIKFGQIFLGREKLLYSVVAICVCVCCGAWLVSLTT